MNIPAQISCEGVRVLIAEDEFLIALDMADTLRNAGATVLGPARSIGKALDIVDQNTLIDAAILDIRLERTFVWPVAERLWARRIPFCFHTGHAASELIGSRWSNIPVLNKPSPRVQLVETVASLAKSKETGEHRACG